MESDFDVQGERPPPMELDEITKSFQRESEALREICRNKDAQINALKKHCEVLAVNFKSIVETILEKSTDSGIKFHAKELLKILDEDIGVSKCQQ